MTDQAESLRRLVRAQRDWERMTNPTALRPDADREAAARRDATPRTGPAPRPGRGDPRSPG